VPGSGGKSGAMAAIAWIPGFLEGFVPELACVPRPIRITFKQELEDRVMAAIDHSRRPWSYKSNQAAFEPWKR
jgi:hypothetical protein